MAHGAVVSYILTKKLFYQKILVVVLHVLQFVIDVACTRCNTRSGF